MKLRSQLLALVLLPLLLTAITVIGIQTYISYLQTEQRIQAVLQDQASRFALQLNAFYTYIQNSGQLFAAGIQDEPVNIPQKLERLHNTMDIFDNLLITTPSGTIQYIYPNNPLALNRPFSYTNHIAAAVRFHSPKSSPIIINETTGKRVISIAQPIFDRDGQVVALLVQNLKLDMLAAQTNASPANFASQTLLFSAQGQGIAPYPGVTVSRSILEQYQSDLGDTKLLTNDQGEKMWVATSRVQLPGWGVAVTMPHALVMKAFYAGMRYGLYALLILFVGLLGLSIFWVNRLFQPIAWLTEEIRKLTHNPRQTNPIDESYLRQSPEELRTLCHSFNQMAATIQTNVQELTSINEELRASQENLQLAQVTLEEKVQLRTQELHALNQELTAMNQELQAVNDTLHHEVLERRRAEEQLSTANQELNRTLVDLQTTQEGLIQAEKMASLGNLVAGISHEINTPVGVSVTAASHLRQITEDLLRALGNNQLRRSHLEHHLQDCREGTGIILSNLGRAAELIRSFKQVSVDQASEERRTFFLKAYIGETLLSLQPKLKKTKIQVELTGSDTLSLDSSPGAFSQIITNLVINSLTHAYNPQQTGHIRIDVQEQAEQVCLTYSDDGCGMDEATRARIFDPFFTTKRGKGGSGLGLYILYNIVTNQFGGTIECSSALGAGTKFTLLLPRIQPPRKEFDHESTQ